MSTLLSRDTLAGLDPAHRPLVDPADLRPRIVHVGIGAFYRAHQAVYCEETAARSGEPWGTVAVAPRSVAAVDALRAQDHLFSVTERGGSGVRTRVVGSVVDARPMGPQLPLADPEVSVLTLTITEQGYREPLVVDALAAGLTARFRACAAPIAVVSCDNMAGNGSVVRDAVRAAIPDADVLAWLATDVTFPDTIVDRIAPAVTDADLEDAERALGVRDELAVVGESYRQWVLQDAFPAARPPWELAGALVVADVVPYQLMKLRLLNGAHSALAYLGLATGCGTVADAVATDWGVPLVRALGAEVAPTLPGDLDTAAYVEDLVRRFGNPAMAHRLVQIGTDGSLKIPHRWLDVVRASRATPVLELALAAWVNATRPGPVASQVYGTTDPAAAALAACWATHHRPTDLVAALLRLVGAADLADRHELTRSVAARLPALRAGRIEL